MTRYPECAATDEGPGANYPSPTMGNFVLQQLRESAGNPFRACVRASAKFHTRMAGKYGVDSPRGMAHYKLAEAFGNPTTRLQEFIMKHGEFGNIPPKAVCKAHKDSIDYHKKEAEKAGLHTPMGHAHISAMAHHVDELNQAKQKMQASQFGHGGRSSPVPGIPKKSEQPSQDIRQNKPLIRLRQRREAQEHSGDGQINEHLRKRIGEAGDGQYVTQRYDQSHPEGFKVPASGGIKPSGYDREARAFEGRAKVFSGEARAYGRTAFGPVRSSGEVSPPGWRGTVKAMQRHKDLKTPWALAWWMKGKGYTPHKKEAQEKAPPGWKGTVRAMKKHKKVKEPYALARWMSQQGYTPHKKESHSLESRRLQEDDGELHPITLAAGKPKLIEGWSGGAYSPPVSRIQHLIADKSSRVVIKETGGTALGY
jgi:hypothetical protein